MEIIVILENSCLKPGTENTALQIASFSEGKETFGLYIFFPSSIFTLLFIKKMVQKRLPQIKPIFRKQNIK